MRISIFVVLWLGLSSTYAQDLIHYWHFNAVTGDTLVALPADFSALGTAPEVVYQPAFANVAEPGWMDDVGGSSLNARLGEGEGRGIRPRNPADSMELVIQLPSTGYENLILRYATERTNSGMLNQVIYATTDGITFSATGDTIKDLATSYELVTLDFSSLAGANDNPDFAIKIRWEGQATGSSGNNRFDNITLEGDALALSSRTMVHYWHFNTADGDSLYSVTADYTTTSDAPSITYRSQDTMLFAGSRMDDVGGSTVNSRLGEPAGRGIRPRNPSENMELVLELPTVGYKNPSLSYATERSGSGMLKQVLYVTVDGTTYTQVGDTVVVNTSYSLVTFDFDTVTGSANNPDFGAKLLFFEQNTGTSGNNRFDNVVLEADTFIAVTGVVISPSRLLLNVGDSAPFDATVLPPNAENLSVTWASLDPAIAEVNPSGVVTAIGAGMTGIVVTTTDGSFADTARVSVVVPPVGELMYYWHFNTLETPTDVTAIPADFAYDGDANSIQMVYEGTGNRDIDTYSPGSDLNLQLGEEAGIAARVRNRSEDRALVFNLPSLTGSDLTFVYSVHRSGSGMLKNIISYSVDGVNFIQDDLPVTEFDVEEDYTLVTVNLEGITAANDNPDFHLRITWEGNTDQENGNNRYDNIALFGNFTVSTDQPLLSHVIVYPNPSRGLVRVQHRAGRPISRLTVLDLQGREVASVKDQDHIDLSQQARGSYFLLIEVDGQTLAQRLMLH